MNLKEIKKNKLLVSICVANLKNRVAIEETFYSLSKQTYKPDVAVFYDSSLPTEDIQTISEIVARPCIILRGKTEDGEATEEKKFTDGSINYTLLPTDVKTFPQLFNETLTAAIESGYELFSVIEPEDIVAINWFKLATEYHQENEKIHIFLPLVRNSNNGLFTGFLNEAVWVEGLSEEAGKLDISLLNRFNCIIPAGAVFKTDAIKEYSLEKDGKYLAFKENIKLSHSYEFFLRMIYNDLKAYTIPRTSYEMRGFGVPQEFNPISYKVPQNIASIPVENGGITADEGKFWMAAALKEYYYDKHRDIIYVPKKV